MSDFSAKNQRGLMEAYTSIYNNSNNQEILNEEKVEQEFISEEINIDTDALYESMIQYLVLEGYASTEKQAENMLPHLSEEWSSIIIGDIIISEQVVLLVNSLLNEGYDFSSYTWNQIYEEYAGYLNGVLNESYADTVGVDPITGALIGGLGAAASGAKYVSDMQQRNAARQLEKAGQLFTSLKKSGKTIKIKNTRTKTPATNQQQQQAPGGQPPGSGGGPNDPKGPKKIDPLQTLKDIRRGIGSAVKSVKDFSRGPIRQVFGQPARERVLGSTRAGQVTRGSSVAVPSAFDIAGKMAGSDKPSGVSRIGSFGPTVAGHVLSGASNVPPIKGSSGETGMRGTGEYLKRLGTDMWNQPMQKPIWRYGQTSPSNMRGFQ